MYIYGYYWEHVIALEQKLEVLLKCEAIKYTTLGKSREPNLNEMLLNINCDYSTFLSNFLQNCTYGLFLF